EVTRNAARGHIYASCLRYGVFDKTTHAFACLQDLVRFLCGGVSIVSWHKAMTAGAINIKGIQRA
ncbi:hypothetical protein N9M29_06045, partial [Alphaproteobacteria bacterium]|nr:hypothetical protein [Alphaproteobacteria bacterium]